jgi:glycosyltransferase involved in cell wall biosynthesis
MDYLIVLPIINNEHLVDRCIKSIPDKKKLLIIDNSPNRFGRKYIETGAEILYYPQNIGVSAAWNIGLKRDHEYTVLLSASMMLYGDIEQWLVKANDWGVYSYHGWHLVGIRKATVSSVGYFDEKFYPAYYEDNDYHYRMKLKGIEFDRVLIDATSAGNAMSMHAGVPVRYGECANYYKKKWGGNPNEEKYAKPFNQ